ncbi:COP23 domain-containing protein [Calothrix sp. CCY 0018]|uniref:COP23 domain-containing protein n=1 Tax=Calothrix sp. CCY 0018 TaxID=3103864 RepID=UPI0039C75D49
MQRKSFLRLGISALTSVMALTSSISPSFSQMIAGDAAETLSQANTNNSERDSVTFMCKDILDPASDQQIPATVVWVPKRQTHVLFIAWKSEYFSNWSPKKRCEAVTQKFQKSYKEGRLSYLTTGKYNGYPVICAAKPGETCNQNNQLFTIKQGNNPQLVLQRLLNISEGKSSEPLYQNSGKQLHLEVQTILDYAPSVKVED